MSNKKGFTLIELLIVIVIIGILSVAVVPRVLDYPKKARDAQRKQSLAALQTAVTAMVSDKEAATTEASNVFKCFDNTGASGFSSDIKNYIGDFPKDPGTAIKYLGFDPACAYYSYALTVNNGKVTAYALITPLEIKGSGNYKGAANPAKAEDVAIESGGTGGDYYAIKQTNL